MYQWFSASIANSRYNDYYGDGDMSIWIYVYDLRKRGMFFMPFIKEMQKWWKEQSRKLGELDVRGYI